MLHWIAIPPDWRFLVCSHSNLFVMCYLIINVPLYELTLVINLVLWAIPDKFNHTGLVKKERPGIGKQYVICEISQGSVSYLMLLSICARVSGSRQIKDPLLVFARNSISAPAACFFSGCKEHLSCLTLMHFRLLSWNISCHILIRASGGDTSNLLPLVDNMSIAYSWQHADGMIKFTPLINFWNSGGLRLESVFSQWP